MPRSRVFVTSAVVAALVVVAVVAYLAVFSSPWPVGSVPRDDLRADTTGQAVPPILEPPEVRIAAAGDTGTGTPSQAATAERMIAESQDDGYDALLLLGDMIYPQGDVATVESRVIEPYAPIVADGATLLPVLGNHDYGSGDEDQIMAALGRPDRWYVEQIGSVRVVVLDSNRVRDATQTDWLRATLEEPQPPGTWTVVAMHHPAYSAGSHGSDLSVQRRWGPLFAAADVPLVLAGHDHDYQRSTPQDGVTYVVSGAGAQLRPTGRAEFTAVSASTLHYLDLLFYDDRLIVRAIDQSGVLVDTFAIDADTAVPPTP